jgi:hypothetical protein
MSVSRGNNNDITFGCFDENNAIEGFFLEQKMCNAFDYFIQFRVADPPGIFRGVMPFGFDVFSTDRCRGNDGDVVPNGARVQL